MCLTTIKFVLFLLGKSPAFEFYVPTFRNTLCHLHRCCKEVVYTTFEDGTDRVFRNVGTTDVGDSPSRNNTEFRKRRK